MGTSPQEDQQNDETLFALIQEMCSAPLPVEYATSKAAINELDADNLMAELGEDKEIQELLLKRIREKGLARKLLAGTLKD